MSVAHDASSESHVGSNVSVSETSFSWTHTPIGPPRGALVIVFTRNSLLDSINSVTYGGDTMTRVSGGQASNFNKVADLFFLGSGLATGAQTVVVNRDNDLLQLTAVGATVTANVDTGVPSGSIELLEGSLQASEQNCNDSSPGSNSLRYAGGGTNRDAVDPPGANSTALESADFGADTRVFVRETTAGEGDRPVGMTSTLTDVTAYVHFAVAEINPNFVGHYAYPMRML